MSDKATWGDVTCNVSVMKILVLPAPILAHEPLHRKKNTKPVEHTLSIKIRAVQEERLPEGFPLA